MSDLLDLHMGAEFPTENGTIKIDKIQIDCIIESGVFAVWFTCTIREESENMITITNNELFTETKFLEIININRNP